MLPPHNIFPFTACRDILKSIFSIIKNIRCCNGCSYLPVLSVYFRGVQKKRSFQKRDAETKKLFGGTLCKYA